MRAIRFRAKPCYMGGNQPAWVYGTFQYIAQRRFRPGATDNGTLEPRNDKGRIVDIYGTETEVLCDTVGQFTGLRDMNGKCIYEGDVVKRHCSAYGLDDIGVVIYDDEEAMFVLRCEKRHYTKNLPFLKHETFNDGHCSIDETYTYEVIGNIYDDQISMEDLI